MKHSYTSRLSIIGLAFTCILAIRADNVWHGEFPVFETTASIMKRNTEHTRYMHEQSNSIRRRNEERMYNQLNPDAPLTSHLIPDADMVKAHARAAAQQLLLNFTAAQLSDTNAFPPDTMGTAGFGQFIIALNNRIRSFNKYTGAPDGILNISTDSFFQSIRNGSYTSDPRIRYDRFTARWFITAITIDAPNRILIAVSDRRTVSVDTVWAFFYLQQNLVTPTGDARALADYPTLGIDKNALYIGVNMFAGFPESFTGSAVFVIRKSSITGAGPIVATAFRNLTTNSRGAGPYAPQGVDNFDSISTDGYVIGVDNANFGRLMLRKISNPGGTPTISANIPIIIPATQYPILVPHKGNTAGRAGYLDPVDDRLMCAHIRNGHLWTTHAIGVNNQGISTGTITRNGCRWYDIDLTTTTGPTVYQVQTLFTQSVNNDTAQRHYWIPSLMTSGQNHMVLGCSTAGSAEYANAAFACRLAIDPLSTLRAPILYTTSTTAYNPAQDTGGSGGRRWGDYSYTCVDPCDNMTFWTIQEFCNVKNSYGVRAAKIQAPPPATLSVVTPSSVAHGTASTTLDIRGISSNGSGFFDPGTGFFCRLQVAISGNVTVNKITYVSPTRISVNISTIGATTGAQTITITNPDGQVVSAPGALTII